MKKSLKQQALELVAQYIINYQLFIDYAGINAFDMVIEFMDSYEFRDYLKPVMADIQYLIKDLVNDPDTNPSQLYSILAGLIDYYYTDKINKAINEFFNNPYPEFN